MSNANLKSIADAVKKIAHPLTGTLSDYDELLNFIGDARFVLIGEASHGTHDFYHERAEITKRLVAEKGFNAVAIEADFPDAYRINRYVRGMGDDPTPLEALGEFKRFPMWMWRNTDILEFVGWLRQHNDSLAADAKVGFYGLDLYSLYGSMEAVLRYLDQVDPDAAKRARDRYACFESASENSQAYGYAVSFGLTEPCQTEVLSQLLELQQRRGEYAKRDGQTAEEEFFFAEQNAWLVKNAEAYYRSLFLQDEPVWNLRDRHMAETLDHIVEHFDRQGKPSKIILWEHNSHLGDARATQMAQAGELNVGQLVRDRYGSEAILIGFTTYTGTVTAASNWDAPAELKQVRPALTESYEAVFHAVDIPRFWVNLRDCNTEVEQLGDRRLERAIGVIYRPETERYSHYFYARLPEQFDAIIHLDDTRAVEPLDHISEWDSSPVPETYPSAI